MGTLRKKNTFMSRKYHSLLLTATFSVVIECIIMLSDTVVVGHLIGEDGISGLNLVLPIFSVVAFTGLLLSMGTVYRYSAEIGQFHKEKADQLFGQGLLVSLTAGIVLFLMVFYGENIYFHFMNPSAAVTGWARDYYQYFRFTVLLYPLYLYLAEMVYTDGDEAACNASYAAQIIGNIILSIFLCMKMGTAGASLGTLIGTILSILFVCSHFFKKKNSLHFVPYFSMKEFLQVCSYSIVDAGLYLFWAILSLAMNKYFIVVYGDFYLPVLSVLISIVEFTMVFDGAAEALIPLYNQYDGEENDPGIQLLMKIASRAAILEGIVFSVILFIAAPVIPKLFAITRPELVHAITLGVRIYVPTTVLTSLLFLNSTYAMMKKHAAFAFSITAVKDLVFPLILSILISGFAGMNGIWIGFLLSPVLAFVYWAVMSMKLYGKENFPLMLHHHKTAYIYSLQVNETEIPAVISQLRKDLQQEGICRRTVDILSTLIENSGKLIQKKNKNRTVYAEISIVLGEDLLIIQKDNGAIQNLMQKDARIPAPEQDLLSEELDILSKLLSMTTNRKYLVSVSFNRHSFHLPR